MCVFPAFLLPFLFSSNPAATWLSVPHLVSHVTMSLRCHQNNKRKAQRAYTALTKTLLAYLISLYCWYCACMLTALIFWDVYFLCLRFLHWPHSVRHGWHHVVRLQLGKQTTKFPTFVSVSARRQCQSQSQSNQLRQQQILPIWRYFAVLSSFTQYVTAGPIHSMRPWLIHQIQDMKTKWIRWAHRITSRYRENERVRRHPKSGNGGHRKRRGK